MMNQAYYGSPFGFWILNLFSTVGAQDVFVKIREGVSFRIVSDGFRGVHKGRTPPHLNFEEQNFFAISIKR